VVLVEIEGLAINVKPMLTSSPQLEELKVDCTDASNSSQVVDRARNALAKFTAEAAVLELVGRVSPEVKINPREIHSILKRDFHDKLLLAIYDKTSVSRPLDEIAKENTVRGEFVRLMTEQLQQLTSSQDERRKLLEQAFRFGLDAFEGVMPQVDYED
jgi:hypothetical protein